MSIACVTFDLDDTLWDTGPVIVEAERVFHAWLFERCPKVRERHDEATLLADRRAHYARHPELAHDLTALRKHWLARVLARHGYPATLAEEGFRRFWTERNRVRPFDGVREVLGTLGARYAVGAITNGNADVDHVGIGHLFDFVVTSATAGASKPAPAIFHAAIAAAGAEPGRVAHVGDDPERDVRGSAAVGMRSVWYNPARVPWSRGPAPDAEVASLAELPGLLAGW